RIGPRDILTITSYPKGIFPDEVIVKPDGNITLPYIGTTSLNGLTIFEASDKIQSLMKNDFKRPWIQIMIKEYAAKKVKVLGEINSSTWRLSGQGEYALKEASRILDFLSTIGGFTDKADIKNIVVLRKDGSRKKVDLSLALEDQTSSENIALKEGDLIYVPASSVAENRVMVLGRVVRQGIYNIGPTNNTLMTLISESGGFTEDSAIDRVQVVRKVDGKLVASNVEANKIIDGQVESDFMLQSNDIIYVPSSTKDKDVIDRLNDTIKDVVPSLNLIWLLDRLID
ncbi:MAG TPA: SLBB domain-containing protein, partial [bacterium]|nr:SLBB domain-containing protein [bacterium]